MNNSTDWDFNKEFSLVVLVYFSSHTVYIIIFTTIFWLCRNIQPIKSRSSKMIVVSTIAGEVILANILRSYFKSEKDFLVHDNLDHQVLLIFSPLFFLSYIARAWRLGIRFRVYENKTSLDLSRVRVDSNGISNDFSFEQSPHTHPLLQTLNLSHKSGFRKSIGYLEATLLVAKQPEAKPFELLIFGYKFDVPLIFLFLVTLISEGVGSIWVYGLGPDISSSDDAHSFRYFQPIFYFISVFLLLLSVWSLSFYGVKDEFNISNELKSILFVWMCTVTPAQIIFILSNLSILTLDRQIVTLIVNILYFLCVSLSFTISVVWPTLTIVRRGINEIKQQGILKTIKSLNGVDEVLLDLQHTLENEHGRKYFKQFVQLEFNSENYMFYLGVENFRNVEANKQYNTALLLYTEYLHENADNYIYISSEQLLLIERALERNEVTPHIFDGAHKEIFNFMQKDTFPRFKESRSCKSLIKKLKQEAELFRSTLTSEDSSHMGHISRPYTPFI